MLSASFLDNPSKVTNVGAGAVDGDKSPASTISLATIKVDIVYIDIVRSLCKLFFSLVDIFI